MSLSFSLRLWQSQSQSAPAAKLMASNMSTAPTDQSTPEITKFAQTSGFLRPNRRSRSTL